MRFRNREEAACLLAERLAPTLGQHPLVLAVPSRRRQWRGSLPRLSTATLTLSLSASCAPRASPVSPSVPSTNRGRS